MIRYQPQRNSDGKNKHVDALDGHTVGQSFGLQKGTFLLEFGNVLRLFAKVRNFNQTDFAAEWTKAGLPLEVFFLLCNQPSSDVEAKSVQLFTIHS